MHLLVDNQHERSAIKRRPEFSVELTTQASIPLQPPLQRCNTGTAIWQARSPAIKTLLKTSAVPAKYFAGNPRKNPRTQRSEENAHHLHRQRELQLDEGTEDEDDMGEDL